MAKLNFIVMSETTTSLMLCSENEMMFWQRLEKYMEEFGIEIDGYYQFFTRQTHGAIFEALEGHSF